MFLARCYGCKVWRDTVATRHVPQLQTDYPCVGDSPWKHKVQTGCYDGCYGCSLPTSDVLGHSTNPSDGVEEGVGNVDVDIYISKQLVSWSLSTLKAANLTVVAA